MTPPANANGNKTIPARVCCPKGPAHCKGSIPTYKLVFDKSEGRNPECFLCGTDYKIPPGISKDPKKVPRPARSKTPIRPISPRSPRAPTPRRVSFDQKDEEIKRLRQLNKELRKANGTTSQENTQQNDDLEKLKEAKKVLGTLEKLGMDKTEIQAKIEALEIKCAKMPSNANSETLKRKLRNAENRANQLAQNVHKTAQLLESQKTALGDAEEEVMRLTEEHKQALKNEGFEKAAVPETLLNIPEHLEGQSRDAYKAKLDEYQAAKQRFEQEAAAITGNLQAFVNSGPPNKEGNPDQDKMDEDGEKHAAGGPAAAATGPTNENNEAAKKVKEAKRAEANKAAQARVASIAAEEAAKKQRCGENVSIDIDDDKDDF